MLVNANKRTKHETEKVVVLANQKIYRHSTERPKFDQFDQNMISVSPVADAGHGKCLRGHSSLPQLALLLIGLEDGASIFLSQSLKALM